MCEPCKRVSACHEDGGHVYGEIHSRRADHRSVTEFFKTCEECDHEMVVKARWSGGVYVEVLAGERSRGE
jgi:hypothetical protein